MLDDELGFKEDDFDDFEDGGELGFEENEESDSLEKDISFVSCSVIDCRNRLREDEVTPYSVGKRKYNLCSHCYKRLQAGQIEESREGNSYFLSTKEALDKSKEDAQKAKKEMEEYINQEAYRRQVKRNREQNKPR